MHLNKGGSLVQNELKYFQRDDVFAGKYDNT